MALSRGLSPSDCRDRLADELDHQATLKDPLKEATPFAVFKQKYADQAEALREAAKLFRAIEFE